MTVNVVGHGYYDECYCVETATNQWDVIWSGIVPHYGCTFKNITIYTPIREFTYYTTSGNIHFYGENNRPVSATITFEGTPINFFTLRTSVGSVPAAAQGASTSPASRQMRVTAGATYTVAISATASTADYAFSGWVIQSGYATITDPTLSSTSVVINIPEYAEEYSDVTLVANYVRTTRLYIEVLPTNDGTISPMYASGSQPLSETFTFTPDRHARFKQFNAVEIASQASTSYSTNPAIVTVNDSSTLSVTPDYNIPIEIVIEPDPSYGIITLSPGKDMDWPEFIEGFRGKGLGWWHGVFPSSYQLKITCTDNPNNPPGVRYLGYTIPVRDKGDTRYAENVDTYDLMTGKWTLDVGRYVYNGERRDVVAHANFMTYYTGYPPKMKRFGSKIVFRYSASSSGGQILYGNEHSIIYGADGNILWGLKDPPS